MPPPETTRHAQAFLHCESTQIPAKRGETPGNGRVTHCTTTFPPQGQVLAANAKLTTGYQTVLALIVEPEVSVLRIVVEAEANWAEIDKIHVELRSEVHPLKRTVVRGHIKTRPRMSTYKYSSRS